MCEVMQIRNDVFETGIGRAPAQAAASGPCRRIGAYSTNTQAACGYSSPPDLVIAAMLKI